MCSLAWAAIPQAKIANVLTVLETQKSQIQVSTSLPLKNHQERSIPGSTSWLAKGFLLFALPALYVNLCVQYCLPENSDWISTNLNALMLTKLIASGTSCPHRSIALKSWVLDFVRHSWRITKKVPDDCIGICSLLGPYIISQSGLRRQLLIVCTLEILLFIYLTLKYTYINFLPSQHHWCLEWRFVYNQYWLNEETNVWWVATHPYF